MGGINNNMWRVETEHVAEKGECERTAYMEHVEDISNMQDKSFHWDVKLRE